MNVLQVTEQTITLGTALEAAVAPISSALGSGQSVSTSAIKLTVGGHTYKVVVSFALAS